jgi:uncharacterized protein YutE (UPF0331/DUF86 family)
MLDKVARKIEAIEEYLGILDGLEPDCLKRFADPIHRGATLHYLYLTADGCIVLAELVLKSKGLGTPDSYHESIDLLGDRGIIPAEFAYSFAGIASFRNFLAHDYERVDGKRICSEILGMLPEVRTYLGYIRAAMNLP